MKRSVTLKSNFSGSFGINAPEFIRKWFKGTATGAIDGTMVVETSIDASVEELKELFGEKVEGLDAGSKYLQESLTKDCTAVMQAIKESAMMFQDMEHQLNLTIQRDNREEEILRDQIQKEREAEREAAKEAEKAKK